MNARQNAIEKYPSVQSQTAFYVLVIHASWVVATVFLPLQGRF